MRVRLALVLGVVFVVLVATASFVALWDGGPGRTGVVNASITDLQTGVAKAVAVELPDARHTKTRVFLVRTGADNVQAYLGVSTHLGCRLLLPGDARYGEGFTTTSPLHYFEDPCGGSTYSLAGDCTGGPCPRDLDGYAVEVRDDIAEIDVTKVIRGVPRGA